MPRQTEPNVNNAMGGLLQSMLSRSHVRSENTQAITGHPRLVPDILVTGSGRSPVVIESEYMPAANVETEAKARLGLEAAATGQSIEAAIALRYPDAVGDADDLTEALKGARLSYCVFTQDVNGVDRFPESGWLEGSAEDIADLVRLVSVPRQAVHKAASAMEDGIERVAKILDEVDNTRPGIAMVVAQRLGMANVPQTRRMACAIIANALVFHERIAGMHDGIKPLNLVCGPGISDPQRETLDAWTKILEINYWPIFAVGKDILGQLPAGHADRILRTLYVTAADITATGVDNSHDLTGRVFQRLISDRKYLATFYTLPASAALLARLAVAKLRAPSPPAGEGKGEGEFDWSDAETIGRLRVADFACGTGALLSAVYEQIASRHEGTGGDPAALHKVMMEEVLYGCDVMPSAVHITGSTLAGAQPSVGFYKSRIYNLPYGRQKDGSVAIGSLEFLNSNAQLTQANYTNPALRTGSAGEETAAQIIAEARDGSFDMVIMNPPFTRPGSDWEGSERAEDYIKQFRGLSTELVEQKDMAKSLSRYTKDTCYHGYAGIASAFAALAHKKLKPGGVLALVLPMSAASGLSWQDFRKMLATNYSDLTVLSIAAADNDDLSFSADTGMAECLVIARKLREGAAHRVHFVSLTHRPQGFASANSIASQVIGTHNVRQIEGGPYGGTPLMVGEESTGETITAPCGLDGDSWGSVRLSDYSLAQTAYDLARSKLWLPGASDVELKVVTLSDVGKRGWHDMNIAGSTGPFDKAAPSPTATYPCLWNHDAKQETRMVCAPDSQLLVRPGMESKASEVWATASRAHLNRDFRFNSQPLTAAFTEEKSMGGIAWPNAIFSIEGFDQAFTLWCNCTLGLLLYWWHANRQQSGRGRTTVRAAESLPVLDFRALTNEQLLMVEMIFEEFRDKELQPAYLADADPNRALLDRRVVCDLLGFDEDTYVAVRRLAAKWCAEPSVHGGKARPKGAALVV